MRAIHWFRSDLRLRDNTVLAVAAARADEMAVVFVIDDRLLRCHAARRKAPRR
jgi:deoxyribodipyrimidine photolyase